MRSGGGLSVLVLSDDQIVAMQIQLELEPLGADVTKVAEVDELRAALQVSEFDLVVVSRASESRYGDPGTLVSAIRRESPEAVIIVTFVVHSQILGYIRAGVRYCYLGQPLLNFREYVKALLDGLSVPVAARYHDGEWIPVE